MVQFSQIGFCLALLKFGLGQVGLKSDLVCVHVGHSRFHVEFGLTQNLPGGVAHLSG